MIGFDKAGVREIMIESVENMKEQRKEYLQHISTENSEENKVKQG